MKTFRVKFAPWNPWSSLRVEGNETYLEGIAADFYEEMKRLINFQYEATVEKDFIFGVRDADGTWSGMIGTTVANQSDISGPYFINYERSTGVDFGVPIGFSQLAIVSGMVAGNKSLWLIFQIFSLKVWLLIILSTFTATCTSSLIYALTPSSEKKRRWEVILKYAWTFYSSLLGKDCGSKHRWYHRSVWKSASFRGLQCCWLLGPALVLMYTYQGAITSTFAADKLKPRVETMEQLYTDTSVKPGTFMKSFPSGCLERLIGTPYESLWRRVEKNLKTPVEGNVVPWLEEVANGKEIWIAETFYMKSVVGRRFKYSGKCDVRVTPTDFCTAYIAHAFNKHFPRKMLQNFNKRLRWYTEGHLISRRILSSTLYYDVCTHSKVSATKPLQFEDLFGAFIVFGAGMLSAVIIFALELITGSKQKKKASKNR